MTGRDDRCRTPTSNCSRSGGSASTSTPTSRGRRSTDPSGSSSRSAARPPTSPSPPPASGTARRSLTKVGDDPFGDYVRRQARRVRRRHVASSAPTPCCARRWRSPPSRRRRIPSSSSTASRRRPTCSSCRATSTTHVVTDVAVLWVAGSAMAEEPARSTIRGCCAERDRRPPHRARPRLPAAAVGRAATRRPGSSAAPSTRPRSPSATGPSAASPSGPTTPTRPPTRLLGARRGGRRRQARRPTGCWSPTGEGSASCRRSGSRWCAGSAPATPSAGRSSTACCPAGRPTGSVDVRQRRRRDRGLPPDVRRRHAHRRRDRRHWSLSRRVVSS